MGYKGAIRSIGAAARRAERAAARNQRELDRQLKQYEKMEALEQAALEVAVFENYVDRIQSLHKDCVADVDWARFADAVEPTAPKPVVARQQHMQRKIDAFNPCFLHKWFGLEGIHRNWLKKRLDEAIAKDNLQYKAMRENFQKEHSTYQQWKGLADGVLAGDTQVYDRALTEVKPFAEVADLGTALDISFQSERTAVVLLNCHNEKIVPKTKKILLKSGKVSEKEMPKGEFNELFQDYVCSATIRVAREVFAFLPVHEVISTTLCEMVNSSNGHFEDVPILSVRFTRDVMESINYNLIDPSDCMRNFECKTQSEKLANLF